MLPLKTLMSALPRVFVPTFALLFYAFAICFAVSAVVEAFRTEVQEQRPGLEVSTGAGSPLGGAGVLARRAATGSLLSHPPYLIVDDQSHHEGAS